MFGIIKYIRDWKKEANIIQNRYLLNQYDHQKYHRELLDAPN